MIELITFSELIDKLMTINIKLYNLMDEITKYSDLEKLSEKEASILLRLNKDQIRLVKQRSELKSAIDKKLNVAIKNGDINVSDEIKSYGDDSKNPITKP